MGNGVKRELFFVKQKDVCVLRIFSIATPRPHRPHGRELVPVDGAGWHCWDARRDDPARHVIPLRCEGVHRSNASHRPGASRYPRGAIRFPCGPGSLRASHSGCGDACATTTVLRRGRSRRRSRSSASDVTVEVAATHPSLVGDGEPWPGGDAVTVTVTGPHTLLPIAHDAARLGARRRADPGRHGPRDVLPVRPGARDDDRRGVLARDRSTARFRSGSWSPTRPGSGRRRGGSVSR